MLPAPSHNIFMLVRLSALMVFSMTHATTTPLNCSANPTSTTITTEGDYTFDCAASSQWQLYITGCAKNASSGNTADGSSGGVVTITYHTTTTVLTIVTDIAYVASGAVPGSLENCSIVLMYPWPMPAYVSQPGNVAVWTTGTLRSLSVRVDSALVLRRAVIDLGHPVVSSGYVQNVSVVFGPTSSIVCGGGSINVENTCIVGNGASLVTFVGARAGLTPISVGSLSIVLNGTDVTGAMWTPSLLTFTYSSFAFVNYDLDDYDNLLGGPSHVLIVVSNVIGTIVGSRLLTVYVYGSSGIAVSSFPLVSGTIVATNCSFLGDDAAAAIFDFSDTQSLSVVLTNVSVTGLLLNISTTALTSQFGVKLGPPINVTAHNCTIVTGNTGVTAGVIVVWQNTSSGRPTAISFSDTQINVGGAAAVVTFSTTTATDTSSDVSFVSNVSFTKTVINLLTPAATIVRTVNPLLGPTAVTPTLSHTTIELSAVRVVAVAASNQLTPQPMVALHDVVASSVTLRSCNVQAAQRATTLVLLVAGALRSSVVDIANTTASNNQSSASAHNALVAFVGTVYDSFVLLQASTLARLGALLNVPTDDVVLGSAVPSLSVRIDCASVWCQNDDVSASCSPARHATSIQIVNRVEWPDWVARPQPHCTTTASISVTATTTPAPQLFAKDTASTTEGLDHTATLTAPHDLAQPKPTLATSSAVVYTSLLTTGAAAGSFAQGAVPALQRAATTLRLSAACAAGGSQNNEPDGAMFDNAADNPTGLHFAAGDERSTDFAAGAAVGNALLVAAVGSLSHAVAAVAALAVRHRAAWPLAASAARVAASARSSGRMACSCSRRWPRVQRCCTRHPVAAWRSAARCWPRGLPCRRTLRGNCCGVAAGTRVAGLSRCAPRRLSPWPRRAARCAAPRATCWNRRRCGCSLAATEDGGRGWRRRSARTLRGASGTCSWSGR